MKTIHLFLLLGVVALLLTGCVSSTHSMKSPDNYVEFYRGDFDYSEQVSGEATSVKIFGVDWARLFNRNQGEFGDKGTVDIPIIGGINGNRVNTYAVYNMIKDNPGYDVVLFPQFETKKDWKVIMSTTTVKVSARLGRIKK
jgi:hypothetical protein